MGNNYHILISILSHKVHEFEKFVTRSNNVKNHKFDISITYMQCLSHIKLLLLWNNNKKIP